MSSQRVCNHNADTHTRTDTINTTGTNTTRDAEGKEDNERENRTGHECLTFLQMLLHLHQTFHSRARVCLWVCVWLWERLISGMNTNIAFGVGAERHHEVTRAELLVAAENR